MIGISDIKASIQTGTLIQDKFFKNADFLKDSRGRLISYTGGYTVVVPANVKGEKWAFRCWHTSIKDSKERYSLIGKALKKSKLPYFCSFDYTENGIIVKGESYPITKMRWVDGRDLKKYICANSQDKETIKELAHNFLEMVSELHKHHIAHGDLQHGNILVSDTGQLFLVDYDSVYVPEMKDKYSDIITGLIDYQHPSRKKNSYSSEKLDYFSEAIIYASLLAIAEKPELIDLYNVENTESLLFTSKDYESFYSSQIYKDLKNLNNEEIDRCLVAIDDYLSVKDINQLESIESYLMSIDIKAPAVTPINEAFTIRWKSKGAKTVEISGIGEVALTGYKEIKLSKSKRLTFVLKSETGFKYEKDISIKVAARAVIKLFKADKKYTLDSVPVKLDWVVTNAKSVELLGYGQQSSSGSLIVKPKGETTYTLEVEDDFGKYRADFTIKELPLPLIKQILVPAPNIARNIGIVYQAPKFHLSIPTPTFDTVLSKLKIRNIPNLKKSGYYVHSIESSKNLKSHNIFKSLFSLFSSKN